MDMESKEKQGEQGKHTPGPWRMITRSALHGPNMEWIATIHGDNEHRANARLIAAAPEMLEALKELARMYDNIDGFADLVSKVGSFNLVFAAIAKAEGRD